MRGGSYLVVRRIRMALEHWDRTNISFQEQTVGRHKYSGAPLGRAIETIAANAACDVLIGVQGHRGKILAQKAPTTAKASVEEELTY